MKVRWSSRCAGGCGRWLRVGTHAHRAHRRYWCGPCYRLHTARCDTHTAPETARPTAAPALF